MGLVEYRYDLDDLGQMTVTGKTGYLYRYIDMTAQAETLYDFVRLTIEHELVEELNFLANYDRIRQAIQEVIDMPDRLLDLFIQLCLENSGRLAQRKRESQVLTANLLKVAVGAGALWMTMLWDAIWPDKTWSKNLELGVII